MAIEVVKAKPQAPSKFLVIGEPFSGKTTLASKAPSPLFISTDGNAAKTGLSAVNVKTVGDIKEALELVMNGKEYKTVVIDTVEGVVDIFTKSVIKEFNDQGFRLPNGEQISALSDVPYGRATGTLNTKIQRFAEALAGLKQNVIVLSYSKRKVDDLTQAITLDSEFKNIRFFTKFMDAQVICYTDGEKHRVNIIDKREIMAGEVELGEIEEFLTVIGWELPKKSVKVGKAQKR